MPQVTQPIATKFGQDQAATPTPKDGIVILFSDACDHCQHSIQNTKLKTMDDDGTLRDTPPGTFATQATYSSNGTPVKWIDLNAPTRDDQLASLNMDVMIDPKDGKRHYAIDGKITMGLPVVISVQNGKAAHLIQSGVALEAGDLDRIVAQQQANTELAKPSVGGSTVPNAIVQSPTNAVSATR